MDSADSLVRQEMRRLLDIWERAEGALRRARSADQSDATAKLAVSEALAEWHLASAGLADLGRLLWRHMARHHSDWLRGVLVEVLRPELESLWEDVARLERDFR